MKKQKIIPISIALFLLSLLFYNGTCSGSSSGNGDNVRQVTIKTNLGSSVIQCDRSFPQIGENPIHVVTTVTRVNPDGTSSSLDYQEWVGVNDFINWNKESTFMLSNDAAYQVIVQIWEGGCPACCNKASTSCPGQSASFMKSAMIYFYGISTIDDNATSVNVNVSLNSCNCSGC